MRALIRADLQPAEYWIQLWNDPEKYDQEVVGLFTGMGYAPVEIGHDDLLENAFVKEIIGDMPRDIKEQETKHLIMLGYTSEGQSHFIVTGVNPTEIHIRVKGRLFGRLTKACEHIHRNTIKSHQRQEQKFRLFGFIIKRKHNSPHLVLRPIIEVMEPKRDHPTILGEIIESARTEVFRQSPYEITLVGFTLIAAILLFVISPAIASPIRDLLGLLGGDFEILYVQGALERTYSAFLVTLAVTVISLLTRIFELRRAKPIRWNSTVGIKERL